ncbi:MAG: hypothetical protein JNK87_00405 [Bryobacterales bacterium]|nr:hypothetical protein [Bryobacterales bacterium]
MSMASAGWWIAASLLTTPVWAQADPNAEKLHGLGRALHQDMAKRAKPFDDASVQAYVTAVGNRLVQQLNAPRREYRFEVLNTSDAVAPVAFHDGAVVVPAAFLARVADEAELARGIAHALGHTELPPPVIQSRPGTIPLLFLSCDRTSVVVPIGMRPKQQAMEEDASRFGDDLAQRTAATPDPAAFTNMQQTVREVLNIRAPQPPSLYRRAKQ